MTLMVKLLDGDDCFSFGGQQAEVRVWSKWLTVVVLLHINRLDDREGMTDSQKL
jgi:hypothetical protein